MKYISATSTPITRTPQVTNVVITTTHTLTDASEVLNQDYTT